MTNKEIVIEGMMRASFGVENVFLLVGSLMRNYPDEVKDLREAAKKNFADPNKPGGMCARVFECIFAEVERSIAEVESGRR